MQQREQLACRSGDQRLVVWAEDDARDPVPAAEIPPAAAALPDMAPVLQAAADHGLEILGPPGIPA